ERAAGRGGAAEHGGLGETAEALGLGTQLQLGLGSGHADTANRGGFNRQLSYPRNKLDVENGIAPYPFQRGPDDDTTPGRRGRSKERCRARMRRALILGSRGLRGGALLAAAWTRAWAVRGLDR